MFKTEFAENWQNLSLKDVVDRVKDKNKARSTNVLTISGQYGLVSQTEFFNKSVASKNLDGYLYIENGDFAYNKSYSEGYPFGAIKRLEKYNSGVLSTLYICFRPKSNLVDSDFLKFFFDSGVWHSEVSQIAKEGGRSHGLLNVGVNEFFNIAIKIPLLKEQQRIAKILSSVNEVIEKTEVIIKQTETLKKGLMQQLFTKGIGHIEFKHTQMGDLPESWEVKSVGELSEVKTGGTPSKSNKLYWNGNVKWMASGDIHLQRIEDVTGRITEEGLKYSSARILPKSSIMVALNGQGKTRGTVALLETELACNQSLAAILPNQNFNSEYIYYNLQSRYQELRNLTGDGGRTGLNLSIIKDILLPLPPIAEQNEIIKALRLLDDKIMLETKKVNLIKAIKVGVMQSLLTGKIRVNVDQPPEVLV